MIIRKDTTSIMDCPFGGCKMHSGASAFPLWSIGLSSMEHRPTLHYAFYAPRYVGKFLCKEGRLMVARPADIHL